MHARLFIAAIAVGSLAAFPAASLAKGAGHGGGHGGQGGHGGGHASGSHGGGHVSGSHGGGHVSGSHGGGHVSGSHGGGHVSGSHGGGHAASGKSGGTTSTSSTHVSGPVSGRARDGRPVVGSAVPRTGTPPFFTVPPSFSVSPFFYSARVSPFYRNRFGLGFYGGSYWSNFGYGAYDYYPAPMYDYGYGGSAMPSALPYDQPSQPAAPTGNLRLIIEPGTAQVFVDGYFVGSVDDFSGTLAGLALEAGAHRLEFRAPGYETLTVDVRIEAQRTIAYRGALKPQQP
jgi:PEGA domain